MHLMRQDDMVGAYAQLIRQLPAVLCHVFGAVAAKVIDIEFAVVALAYSSLSGGRESSDLFIFEII